MTDILIRGVSELTVARIDSCARRLELTRNEYLRRHLDQIPDPSPQPAASEIDWARFTEATRDLLDPEILAQAWR